MSKKDDERSQVMWVFGLTGGEMEEVSWAGNKYWYQGVPHYMSGELTNDPVGSVYRTVVRSTLYCDIPEEIEDEDGLYTSAHSFSSSGAVDCPYKESVSKQVNDSGRCPLCDAASDETHGEIFLGDGWAEIVYRMTPVEDDDDL